jgi:hypothetical protein
MRALARTLFVVTGVIALAMLGMLAAAAWTGDGRWWRLALVALLAAVLIGIGGFGVADTADKREARKIIGGGDR